MQVDRFEWDCQSRGNWPHTHLSLPGTPPSATLCPVPAAPSLQAPLPVLCFPSEMPLGLWSFFIKHHSCTMFLPEASLFARGGLEGRASDDSWCWPCVQAMCPEALSCLPGQNPAGFLLGPSPSLCPHNEAVTPMSLPHSYSPDHLAGNDTHPCSGTLYAPIWLGFAPSQQSSVLNSFLCVSCQSSASRRTDKNSRVRKAEARVFISLLYSPCEDRALHRRLIPRDSARMDPVTVD